jgi:hypothetical protein
VKSQAYGRWVSPPLSVWCDEMADGSRLVLLYPYE